MSLDTTRNTLNQIEKELADLERKRADSEKKEADKFKKISDIERSITKNTSFSSLQSKNRQIISYRNDLAKISKEKADLTKKIADKQMKKYEAIKKIQVEENTEKRRNTVTMQDLQRYYEERINNLSSQLTQQIQAQNKAIINNNFALQNDEEYDVFISHASEDKEDYVEDLVKEMNSQNIKVWYDDDSIEWGDNLRTKIDFGLAKSKYGIVILSKDYIRKYWTQQELEGLFQRETTDKKVILPIWHKITKNEVQEFSPMLASRKALNSAMYSIKEVVDELIKLLPMHIKSEETKVEIDIGGL